MLAAATAALRSGGSAPRAGRRGRLRRAPAPHRTARGGGVLELRELCDPGSRQQIGPRREQLTHLEQARALTCAVFDEASGVAGVQTFERRLRAGFRQEGRPRRMQAIARGDSGEHPAGVERALEPARPGAQLGAELAQPAFDSQPTVFELVPGDGGAIARCERALARRPDRPLDHLERHVDGAEPGRRALAHVSLPLRSRAPARSPRRRRLREAPRRRRRRDRPRCRARARRRSARTPPGGSTPPPARRAPPPAARSHRAAASDMACGRACGLSLSRRTSRPTCCASSTESFTIASTLATTPSTRSKVSSRMLRIICDTVVRRLRASCFRVVSSFTGTRVWIRRSLRSLIGRMSYESMTKLRKGNWGYALGLAVVEGARAQRAGQGGEPAHARPEGPGALPKAASERTDSRRGPPRRCRSCRRRGSSSDRKAVVAEGRGAARRSRRPPRRRSRRSRRRSGCP